MSPIARHVVQFTQRIKNPVLRNFTLKLIEDATKQPDLAHFTIAMLKNPSHTSHSEPRSHATVLLATQKQADENNSQPIHIFHDANGIYTSHKLFPERKNKDTDE